MIWIYESMIFGLFEWYSRENELGDHPDEAKYATWAVLSFVGSSLVVLLETTIYQVFSVSFVLYSTMSIPAFVKYAWSFPILLATNHRFVLKSNRGYQIVRRIRRTSRENQLVLKRVGVLVSVSVVLTTWLVTYHAPPLV